MKPHEAQLFNFFMAMAILNKLQKAIEKNDEEKVKKLSKIGLIYSTLAMIH